MHRSRGTGPRATVKKTPLLHVGRGAGPRHAPIARETRSHARMETSEGPCATVKNGPLHRRARACPSPCTDRGGQAPALRYPEPPPYRRARACPSPYHTRRRVSFPNGVMKHPQLKLITIRVFVNRLTFAVGIGIGAARGAGNRIDRFIRLEPQIQFL